MENRIQRLFLSALLCAPLVSWAADDAPLKRSAQVIEPDLQRREIKTPKIDTENFEVGAYYGVLGIQDFGTNGVWGVTLAYHITEDIFVEAEYGSSEGDKTSFEKLSGGSNLLSDDDRKYTYYSADIGWNVLPGEVFIGKYAFSSSLYLIGGVGSTEFAGDSAFTINAGIGYRLLLTDWIAWRIDARDYLFDRNIFGEKDSANNLELRTGFTVFF